MCHSSPCHNGATCVTRESSFKCVCAQGYSGKLCLTSEYPDLTDKQDDVFIFFSFPEVQPDFELSFENSPSTETLDYVLLDGFTEDLKEVIKTKTIMIFIAFLTVHCLFLDVL